MLTKTQISFAVLGFIGTAYLPSAEPNAVGQASQKKSVYICPPCDRKCDARVFDAPGTCPECGMTLVLQAPPQPKVAISEAARQLVGIWVGTIPIDSKPTAVKMVIAVEGEVVKPKIDILAGDGGIDVTSVQVKGSNLSGEFKHKEKVVRLSLSLTGTRLKGSASSNSTGNSEFIKLASPSMQTLKSYEGLYRQGSKFYSCEILNEYWGLTLTEFPSGQVRGMFPTTNRDFTVGKRLMFAVPQERQIMFTADHKMLISENGRVSVASRVPLLTRDVTFRNGDVTLAGTAILPLGKGRHPGVVFMHGSGDSPRTTFMGQGNWLAYLGYAVLKYDKRGSGLSTGSLAHLTYEALGGDGAAAAACLASQREVDPKRVGFWGISEGGWTTALAASMFKPAAFVVAVNGGGLSPADGEIFDSQDQLRSDGRFSAAEIAEAIRFQRLRDHYCKTGYGWDEYFAARKISHEEMVALP